LTGKIIDGLAVADDVKKQVKKAVDKLKSQGIQASLATILVGDDPSSATYIKNKQKAAEEVGIITCDHKLTSSVSQQELTDLVNLLNEDEKIHGILVLLLSGSAYLKPCTPAGIIEMLDFYNIDVSGMDAIIVNRSNLVGKPLAMLLLEQNATVTICHSKTKDLKGKLRQADVVITAVGNREIFTLTSDMIKPGSIVIDVGITRYERKITGDVDFEGVRKKASWITPVPGGVGPMTVSMLLRNTVSAASKKKASDNI
jgi:methylenetetrahydrofolate dehydrogenase (NADP+)/methenyltetrahydrofolate cyclohydrolase